MDGWVNKSLGFVSVSVISFVLEATQRQIMSVVFCFGGPD